MRQLTHQVACQAQQYFPDTSGPAAADPLAPQQPSRARDKRAIPVIPTATPAATSHDSGPVRLNLPISLLLLPVYHDDTGWWVGSRTFEHPPASLVLA